MNIDEKIQTWNEKHSLLLKEYNDLNEKSTTSFYTLIM